MNYFFVNNSINQNDGFFKFKFNSTKLTKEMIHVFQVFIQITLKQSSYINEKNNSHN